MVFKAKHVLVVGVWWVWSELHSLVPLQSVLQLFGEQTLLTNLEETQAIFTVLLQVVRWNVYQRQNIDFLYED